MRGIRGAITVGRNEKEEIWQAAQELVTEILRTNNITPADIGAAIFSVTEDLTAAFPRACAASADSISSPSLTRASALSRAASRAAFAFSSSSTRICRRATSIISTCVQRQSCGRIWRVRQII